MCLAIAKPASVMIPEDHLRTGWVHNSHGAGYSFVKDGKVVICKGFMKLKEFMEAYLADAQANTDSPFIVHFRIASMGDNSDANTHPFPIEGGALIHNGTLSGTSAVYSRGPSDTNRFAQMYSKHLSFDNIEKHKDKWNKALEYSKLVMLYDDKRYQIVNESLGLWVDGVWYSNTSFRGYSVHGANACLPAIWKSMQ